ncbi:MAG: anion-transporting ArsA/GET3 family ATPase [Myxococcota bacterium]|jgi:anion-transporting  ArsA/GET3 family ATPase
MSETPTPRSLAKIIAEKQLLICVGSGGVGKTSMAAAIGVDAARRGRRVLVLTIDPARRLANSLGLERFGNQETRIDLGELGQHGGELWAMMLDPQRTFDELIRRVATDPARQQAILDNHVYQNIADTIVGNQEYMATEKLYDVVSSGRFDLVVLDTPPVKNALDFLESPGRMARFVDKRIMKWFLTPYDEGRVFGRLLMGTSAVLFRLLSYIFGREFLGDLSEFFLHFRDLYEGFQDRHSAVLEMFHSDKTAFLVVTAPSRPATDVALFFIKELRSRKMPSVGVVVNQRHETLGMVLSPDEVLGERAAALSSGLAAHTAGAVLARLGAAHRRLRELSHYEESMISELVEAITAQQDIWQVPRLPGEVHDLQALATVGGLLLGDID